MGKRYLQPLRILVQWGFLFFSLYLGIQFYRFVLHFRSGGAAPFVPRPDGVEAFLPISALLSLKDWLASGSINPIHPAALVIFLTVVAVSFLLKRSFCSWVCPVGTISEVLWKSGFNLFRRNFRLPRRMDLVLRGIKFVLLCFFLYSILYAMAPGQVTAFIYSDYNKMADVRLLDFFVHLSGFSLLVIGGLALLSLPIRNPFCRYLCPYGALLGLISMLSPVKVTREGKTCVSCGVCTQVCPSYIPVMAKERVFSEECIGCLRCISHCRAEGALEMKLTGRKVVVNGLLFAVLVVLLFLGGTQVGKATGHWRTAITKDDYARLIGR
ncbi:4Fe-4S binding protein [Geotalea uraniireducens]|uniref:4Fe-4S ferredoxin, iron-sulfur binding domain protein n=1 Tax=Geotalea uraniireducens (strain Rf4) TaxID=351605 RepID=A5GBX5_GEOUR|nr:4Fe-4S binding protein [Geotalea uraniireducens]ABQ24922.1 4Fe-4S ferredoxin, iron-sulfur binding domain protein [Geotalea uraniireducens Rf4]